MQPEQGFPFLSRKLRKTPFKIDARYRHAFLVDTVKKSPDPPSKHQYPRARQ
jgi:hypothetical protein